jgi:hypothetical protein
MAKFESDFLSEFSEFALIAELRRLARALGKDTLSRRNINQYGMVSATAGRERCRAPAADGAPLLSAKAEELDCRPRGGNLFAASAGTQ